ncbi:MAG: hypothetical protein QOH57_3387 [Mycobacterium sp.]|jgi:hypothetical protein|nr:hypothetical protein [Mycobacterium sp.]
MSIELSGLPVRACFIAEWYRLELGDYLDRAVATIEACASATANEDSSVKLLAMLAVPTDEVVFGIFAAGSSDAVAEVCDRAGLPAQRLTAAFDARRHAGCQGK